MSTEHITQVVVREKKLPTVIGQQILDAILKPHKHKHRKGRPKHHDSPGNGEKTAPAHSAECDENCGKIPNSASENSTENVDETNTEKGEKTGR